MQARGTGRGDMSWVHGGVYVGVALGLMGVAAGADLGDLEQTAGSVFANDLLVGIAILVWTVIIQPRRVSRNTPGFYAVWGGWLCLYPLIFPFATAWGYSLHTLLGAVLIGNTAFTRYGVLPFQRHAAGLVRRRWAMGGLALFCFVLAGVMACYQLGYIHHIWEPFFQHDAMQNGSMQVLHSWISRSLPVSDAGMGAVVYMLETILIFAGPADRILRYPQLVLLNAGITLLAAAVSAALVLLQAFVLKTGCTLCLLVAGMVFALAGFSLSELTMLFSTRKRLRTHGGQGITDLAQLEKITNQERKPHEQYHLKP